VNIHHLRSFPIKRKHGHLAAFLFAVLKYLDGVALGCMLAVVYAAEIEHLSPNNPVVWHSVVINDAPVAMFFSVFESGLGSEKYNLIFQNTILKSRG